MEWMLLYLMKNPNDQEKVYQEIKTLTDNNGRQVNLGDKANAHFTNAFIDEVTRHFEMGVFPPSHKTLQDVVFQGKNIPKGTQVCVFFNVAVAKKNDSWVFFQIMFPLYCINHDERYFPDHGKFKPDRFLDQDGKYKKDEHCIFFGLGKRRCPGEQLARAEVFLFMTSIVQQFQLEPQGNLTYKSRPGQVFYPIPYKFSLKERKDVNFD